jgi:TPR repeat protein
MLHNAKLSLAALPASLMLVAIAGAALAGSFEDGADAHRRGDYDAALRLLLPLDEQGNAGAENNLGFMYERGLGVPQNAEAMKLFRMGGRPGVR